MPNTISSYPRDTDRYRALRARDPQADLCFVYAVTTTGIYCRPSCGARLPRPENTRYFADAEAAEAEGFRACKRCHPRAATPPIALRIVAARQLLEREDEPLALTDLAKTLGTSKYHLHRQFKRETGMTPGQYRAAVRLQRARRGLLGGASVTEALYAAGYASSGRFYAESQALGMPARSVARAAAGETIRSVALPSSLGQVFVAATARGVCWVALGDDAAALEAEFRGHFRNACFEPANRALLGFARSILGFIDRGDVAEDLPLDLMGTRFQLKVWEELRRLRPGDTTSYGKLARKLAAPGAVRAVGTACGQNPLAVIVPCHRVLRQDGALGGYRWGLDRKRELLEREAVRRKKKRA